jgi:hypothetical protein
MQTRIDALRDKVEANNQLWVDLAIKRPGSWTKLLGTRWLKREIAKRETSTK